MPHMDLSIIVEGGSCSRNKINEYKRTNDAGETEGLSSRIRSLIE